MSLRRIVLVVALTALAGLATGCGGGGGGPEELSPEDALTVASFRVDVAKTVLDGSGYGDLLDSMDAVIELARENPDALYVTDDASLTMRQVLSDAASDLAPYQPDLAASLDRAVETL